MIFSVKYFILEFPFMFCAIFLYGAKKTVFQAVFLCYFSTVPTFSNLARHVFFLPAVLLMILSLWNVTLCQ